MKEIKNGKNERKTCIKKIADYKKEMFANASESAIQIDNAKIGAWVSILVGLFVIFLLSVPALILRYRFLKAPLDRKKRWLISIAYCVVLVFFNVFFGIKPHGVMALWPAIATFFILGIKNENLY